MLLSWTAFEVQEVPSELSRMLARLSWLAGPYRAFQPVRSSAPAGVGTGRSDSLSSVLLGAALELSLDGFEVQADKPSTAFREKGRME